MFCKNCGNELLADAKFCVHCGTTAPTEEELKAMATAPVELTAEQVQDNEGQSLMITSIVALALSEAGLPGLILARVARSKLTKYLAKYGKTRGFASIGKVLSIGALAYSAYYTTFWTIFWGIYGAWYLFLLAALGAA